MNLPFQRTESRFTTTLWTLVHAAGNRSDEGHAALSELVQRYWPSVYGYLRRTGKQPDVASELTQAFFADVVLTRELFARADASKGRLRTLILSALKNYEVDQYRKSDGQRYRLALSRTEFEEAERTLCAEPANSAEAEFDLRWALAQMREALRRCELHFSKGGKPGHWAAFAERVVRPCLGHFEAPPLSKVAIDHGFASPADAAAAIQTVKKRLLAILGEVAAETAGDEAASREELESLTRVLG